MCVLNALRGDLKLEMDCPLIEMENVLWVLGVEVVKGLDVRVTSNKIYYLYVSHEKSLHCISIRENNKLMKQ